jgi:hypothetical protein
MTTMMKATVMTAETMRRADEGVDRTIETAKSVTDAASLWSGDSAKRPN